MSAANLHYCRPVVVFSFRPLELVQFTAGLGEIAWTMLVCVGVDERRSSFGCGRAFVASRRWFRSDRPPCVGR